MTLFTSRLLHTSILIHGELFKIQIQVLKKKKMLEGTKIVQQPVVGEASSYLAAFSLDAKKREQTAALAVVQMRDRYKSNAR